MRRLAAGTGACLLSLVVLQAFVIEDRDLGRPIKWTLSPPFDTESISTNVVNPVTRSVRYFLGSEGWSATNRVNELNALRASFAQWQAISGTILKFEEGGLVGPGVDVNLEDNHNVVFFSRNPIVNGGRDHITGVAGKAYVSYYTDNNELAESDIVLNGFEFQWYTDIFATNTLAKFVEGVALHEIGHLIGLLHTPVGGATMFHAGDQGQNNLQAGLADDELAAARALYPQPTTAASYGHLRGQVTLNGLPVLGAVVVAEDASGSIESGTVTRADGFYDLSYLPPGAYQIRVSPLDPNNASNYLLRGRDISNYFRDQPVNSSFLPTGNHPATLTAGVTSTLNLSVTGATPPFRISHLRTPTSNPNLIGMNRVPVAVRRGQSNLWLGVFGTGLPTNNATLAITGDGLTLGELSFNSQNFPGTNLISVQVHVATNATPGLRSFQVTRSSDGATAWANGFLEIQPDYPDANFDGLDDLFQRRWFPLFTAPEAAPGADPDGDTYTNQQEYQGGGSNPTLASAIPQVVVERVTLTANGSTVVWRSVPGKRYQLQSRANFNGAPWQPVGTPVTADATTTQAVDPGATVEMLFYRVQVVP